MTDDFRVVSERFSRLISVAFVPRFHYFHLGIVSISPDHQLGVFGII